MFNRSGLIALAIAGAIVAWGAIYKDDPEPKPAHSSRRHDDAPRSDHGGRDGGLGRLASAGNGSHVADGGASLGRFDGPR